MPQSDDLPVLTIDNLRGGRNGGDPPGALPDQQCQLAFNIDWFRATVARKRGGSSAMVMTGGTSFTGNVAWLGRYSPDGTDANTQLLGVDNAATPAWRVLTGGTSWADVATSDAVSAGFAPYVNGVTFNGKEFLAFKSAVDRLHVKESTGAIRRAGLAVPTAPTHTVAAGAVTDTRTYKVAWTVQVGGVTVRRSELSVASTAQALAVQQDTLTRGTAPGEGETHWELYGASTDALYWRIATTVIATTTAVDNNATLSAVTGVIAPQSGINTAIPSGKYLSTDGNRLFIAGAWETAQPGSRVWFTPVLGDNNIGDDERYVNSATTKHYLDLNENDGGRITGISLPQNNYLLVFKKRQIWKIVPTGEVTAPYLPYRISSTIGCIEDKTIQAGEDAGGNPCIYFMSERGPYRYGASGLEYLGGDLEDLFPNFLTQEIGGYMRAVYHPGKGQYWLWVTYFADTNILVFDRARGIQVAQGSVRGGWSVFTGVIANAIGVTLYHSSIGATNSGPLIPFIGISGSANTILLGDQAVTSDNGTAFRAYIRTKAFAVGGEGSKATIQYPLLTGEVSSGVSIQVSVVRDYAAESKSGSTLLTASGTETRVIKKVEGATLAGGQIYQFEIGDASAVASAWKLDKVVVPYTIDQAA